MDFFNLRIKVWLSRDYYKLFIIWGFCLVVCLFLLYMYCVEIYENGEVYCSNVIWGIIG